MVFHIGKKRPLPHMMNRGDGCMGKKSLDGNQLTPVVNIIVVNHNIVVHEECSRKFLSVLITALMQRLLSTKGKS